MISLNIIVVELSISLILCRKYPLYGYIGKEIPGWQGERVERCVCVCFIIIIIIIIIIIFIFLLLLLFFFLTVQYLEWIMLGVGGWALGWVGWREGGYGEERGNRHQNKQHFTVPLYFQWCCNQPNVFVFFLLWRCFLQCANNDCKKINK